MKDIKLWSNSDEEMTVVHRLNNIVRYNTRNKINPETVAAHSFFTSYFVISICKKYNIPDAVKLLALESAVVHDIPEVFINDITYDCKNLISGLESMIAPYEENIISQISEPAKRVLFGPSSGKPKHELLAQAIVEFADTLSVKQYALSEVELGNTTFNEILRGSERRLLIAELAFKTALDLFNKGNN